MPLAPNVVRPGRSRRATTRRGPKRRPADPGRRHVRRRRKRRRRCAGHQIGVRAGRGLLDALPRPAGQFAGGFWRPLDDRCDLVERNREHVVQDERQSFRRCQGVQNHEQRHSDRVGQHRLMLGIDVADGVDDGIRHLGDELFRWPSPAASQGVQADPCHHGRQPRVEVVHLAGVDAGQPQPRFLHGILGVDDRAQHAVGHRTQMRPGGLESRSRSASAVIVDRGRAARRPGPR